MPLFRYQAVNAQGRNLRGVMPAQNETGLERKLKDVGLWLMEAVEEAPADTGVKPQRQFFIRPANGKKQRIRPANPSMRSEQGLADWAG